MKSQVVKFLTFSLLSGFGLTCLADGRPENWNDGIDPADDCLQFDFADDFENARAGEPLDVALSVDSVSTPHLTFSGLPSGLSYDASSLRVIGTPSAPGIFVVSAKGGNANGYQFSQAFRLRVGNVRGNRISGVDEVIEVGEYYYAEFAEMFDVAEEEWTRIALSGLPSWLAWNSDWSLAYGTPGKTGVFVIKAKIWFKDGTMETATRMLEVVSPDPDDYDVDIGVLEGLSVGDVIESQEGQLGVHTADGGIVKITGLPSGLSAETWKDEDGVVNWGVKGRVSQAGRYVTAVVVEDIDSDGRKTKVELTKEIFIDDLACVYFDAGFYDSSSAAGGKVTGGGPVKPGVAVTLTAKPSSGFVFAGWYDDEFEPFEFEDGTDYRKAKIVFPVGTDYALLSLRARFVTKAQDTVISLSALADAEFDLNPENGMEEAFAVDSLSLPSVTFKNLPKGVTCSAGETGGFVLSYDPETVKTRPAPGRYSVTATAVNQSKAKCTATFSITVSNLTDPRINVDDDYGELEPGYEIDPIDLSGAVDFSRGETLSVSGLPSGLKFNKKADVKKGLEANSITGTPTKPGDYVLTFTAKVVSSVTTNAKGKVSTKYVTAKATSFLAVLPWPELSVTADDEALAAGNKVSGGGNYKPGTKVTLKATAAKGWVFAGWDGLGDVSDLDALKPSLTYVTDEFSTDVYANFIRLWDDGLFVSTVDGAFDENTAVFRLGEEISDEMKTLVLSLTATLSLPTVKVAGLPKGLKFDTKKLTFSGKPTKSGIYYVTVTAKNAGGYSFVRIWRFVVTDADGNIPEEPLPKNNAAVDFGEVSCWTTGVANVRSFVIDPSETHGAVAKVSVSGVPSGLKATSVLDEETDAAEVGLAGTPSKPGRFLLKVKATYADRKTAESDAYILVEDGGSAYLSVWSADESLGAVKGSGVYASGEKVKIQAQAKSKDVFAGWYDGEAASTGTWQVVSQLTEVDGLDVRQASVSFPFRPLQLETLDFCACFAAKSEDSQIGFDLDGDEWTINRNEDGEFRFFVESLSYPKVTVKGLPKGVSLDAARGVLRYDATVSKKPASGDSVITLTAKNQSGKSATARVTVHVTDLDE